MDIAGYRKNTENGRRRCHFTSAQRIDTGR